MGSHSPAKVKSISWEHFGTLPWFWVETTASGSILLGLRCMKNGNGTLVSDIWGIAYLSQNMCHADCILTSLVKFHMLRSGLEPTSSIWAKLMKKCRIVVGAEHVKVCTARKLPCAALGATCLRSGDQPDPGGAASGWGFCMLSLTNKIKPWSRYLCRSWLSVVLFYWFVKSAMQTLGPTRKYSPLHPPVWSLGLKSVEKASLASTAILL